MNTKPSEWAMDVWHSALRAFHLGRLASDDTAAALVIEQAFEKRHVGDGACRVCAGTGWVCENHRDHPWAGMANVRECCGGAGAPCGACNLEMASAGYVEQARKEWEGEVVEWLRGDQAWRDVALRMLSEDGTEAKCACRKIAAMIENGSHRKDRG